MDFHKKRVRLLVFVAFIIVLSMAAEKCRKLVPDHATSKSGKFTVWNCLDMGYGSLACGVKESTKLYFHNLRSAHIEKAKNQAMKSALTDAKSQGMAQSLAEKHAKKEGAKAAKLASHKAQRVIGPMISSGWDFFEAVYYGGSDAEGAIRGSGTLFGSYLGGFFGEQRLGRLGFLVGSQMGSWFGGRIGLMLYDILNAIHFLINLRN
ncbi:uncharacterized protein LOC130933574 [Arachis stenosperma]|uniref:uncharacterized protein LOC130933574 n=1 Tax=Arachis stenosperma TaxID=217475 RepID=UPI0025ACF025|nr:uncharacterized protein LOC130933574 [Arachis stenosperma]